MLTPLHANLLKEKTTEKSIYHGFFTRLGGISEGEYASLNSSLVSGDCLESVAENRLRIAQWANVELPCLLIPYQSHSGIVKIVTQPFDNTTQPKADALVTNVPSLALGIQTADCGPVLFVDPCAKIIGAAHAGWKGVLENILENTIDSMVSLGAKRSNISAALGPSISQRNYEVGGEFLEYFKKDDPSGKLYFKQSEKKDHYFFDLNACTLNRLMRAKIQAEAINRCTYAEEDMFYSYRRSCHQNKKIYGRQMSVIVLHA